MGMGGDGQIGNGENLIPTFNPSLNLGTKFIPILIRILSQIGVKQIEMSWGRVGTPVRPTPLPSLLMDNLLLTKKKFVSAHRLYCLMLIN